MRMKFKYLLAILMCLLILVSSSCGQKTEPSTEVKKTPDTQQTTEATKDDKKPAETEEPAPEEREPVTVSVWYVMHPNDIEEYYEDAPGDIALAEATGVTIDWKLVPAANDEESYNLLMASGDLPDVVINNVTQLKRYMDAWLPLDDLIHGNPRYPNLDKIIFDDEYLQAYLPFSDGTNRIIPMLATRLIGDMLLVREDLMKEYGLPDDLVTLDDWYKALKTAKEDGKIPYMTRYKRDGILLRLLGGYSDCMREAYYVDVDEKTVKYGVLEPRFKEIIEIARKWYSEGLIDLEYPTTDSTIWWENVLNGNVFATHDNIMRISAANQEFIVRQEVPYRLMGLGPMQSPVTGKRHTTIHYPRVRHKCAGLSVNAKHVERILDMFEYIFSEEGFLLTNWGVEGYSYEMKDGMPVTIEEYRLKVETGEMKHVGITRDFPKLQKDELIYDYNEGHEYDKNLIIARDLYMNNDFIRRNWLESLNFTEEERKKLAPINTELDTYRGEMLDKFIMGVEPMENWDKFVEEIKKMGVEEALAIYQDVLDRSKSY